MRVTIKEIARELGLSHSTVSRVLNEKQSVLVSEPTRARIMETATRMGYRPNRLAQALQGRTSQLIGILLPAGHDHFFREVETGLRALVEESGYELLPFVSADLGVRDSWHRLLRWDLDGVFVFDYLLYVDGLWEALVEHQGVIPPMIGLFSSQPRLQDYVTFDFRPAMQALLEHFVDQGARSIGYMALPSSFQRGEQRYAAYQSFLERRGLIPQNVPLLLGDNLLEGARHALLAYLNAGNRLPDALFCQNDEIALGAYSALRERDIAIPDSIMLAGCDDIPYVAYLETPLTTLSLPVEAACADAWRFLQKRMAEPSGPALRSILEVCLSIRESTSRSSPTSALTSA